MVGTACSAGCHASGFSYLPNSDEYSITEIASYEKGESKKIVAKIVQ